MTKNNSIKNSSGYFVKKAYLTQMTYQISDKEKKQAEKALLSFSAALKSLQMAGDYLDLMKNPFKNDPNIKPEEIEEARVAVRKFRDKAVDNFNDFKEILFQCVNAMQLFASDTQSVKLMKSLINGVDELEDKVNNFSEIFTDLQSKTFPADAVSAIENIQTQCDDLQEIINDRIKPHIQNNILATSWVDSISQNLQMKVEKHTPLIMDLYNQREEQLNNQIKNNK